MSRAIQLRDDNDVVGLPEPDHIPPVYVENLLLKAEIERLRENEDRIIKERNEAEHDAQRLERELTDLEHDLAERRERDEERERKADPNFYHEWCADIDHPGGAFCPWCRCAQCLCP